VRSSVACAPILRIDTGLLNLARRKGAEAATAMQHEPALRRFHATGMMESACETTCMTGAMCWQGVPSDRFDL
jgi:hypothetical protein